MDWLGTKEDGDVTYQLTQTHAHSLHLHARAHTQCPRRLDRQAGLQVHDWSVVTERLLLGEAG